jgi:Bacterial capsule synthesis protein PGA_cap
MKSLLIYCSASLWCVQVLAQSVSVVVVGDIMLEGGPMRAMQRGQDPFASFASLFKSADVRVGNLECVVATVGTVEPDKPNTFRVPPSTLKYVRKHFDAVGLANNHSGDFGPKAFTQMVGLLKREGLGYYGGGLNLSEAHTPWGWSAKVCALRFWATTNFNRATSRLTTTALVLRGAKTNKWCATSRLHVPNGVPMW